jgi:hypothetical protein
MAEAPRAKDKEKDKDADGKHHHKPVRHTGHSGVGMIPAVIGLVLALVAVGFVYRAMQQEGRGDSEYWNEYLRIAPQLHGADPSNADQVWTLVYSLPRHKVTEPMLIQLHDVLIEFATAIRDPDGFKKKGPELEARMLYYETEIPEQLGTVVKGSR